VLWFSSSMTLILSRGAPPKSLTTEADRRWKDCRSGILIETALFFLEGNMKLGCSTTPSKGFHCLCFDFEDMIHH
jgi:hypothetical protein